MPKILDLAVGHLDVITLNPGTSAIKSAWNLFGKDGVIAWMEPMMNSSVTLPARLIVGDIGGRVTLTRCAIMMNIRRGDIIMEHSHAVPIAIIFD